MSPNKCFNINGDFTINFIFAIDFLLIWMDVWSVETDLAHVPASQRWSSNAKQRVKCTWGCEPQQIFSISGDFTKNFIFTIIFLFTIHLFPNIKVHTLQKLNYYQIVKFYHKFQKRPYMYDPNFRLLVE